MFASSILLASAVLAQQDLPLELPDQLPSTQMCPPELKDSNWVLVEQYYTSPHVQYSKYTTQKLGQRRLVDDSVVIKETPNPLTGGVYKWNPIVYRDIIDYEVIVERWEDRRDWAVINVEWKVTVKNYKSQPYTGTNFRFLLPTEYCPYVKTQIQGNIYWDWMDSTEYYEETSTPEEFYLYSTNGAFVNLHNKWTEEVTRADLPYLFIDRRGRESIKYKSVIIGRGGDMFFGCRRVLGPMYDEITESWVGDRDMPRTIDWNGEDWKWRFPPEENAVWELNELPENSENPGRFSLFMQFKTGGAVPIRYDAEGQRLPEIEWEWIPNVVVFHAHAELRMLNFEFPPEGCPVPALDQEPDYSDDEIIMIVD